MESDLQDIENQVEERNRYDTVRGIFWYESEEKENQKNKKVKSDQSSEKLNFSISIHEDLNDIVDAVTGEPIQLSREECLYQCLDCSVVYLPDSYEFLKKENYEKCVGCGSGKITPIKVTVDLSVKKLLNLDPRFVTLDNYKMFENKLIQFTGVVVKILESRRGDYALMFEDKPWVEGFKLIVFYPLMKSGKGLERSFLQSLVNKKIQVRGLIKRHEVFGYEIIIYSRKMIKVLD